ncbi:NAD(P)-binding protein [Mycena rebaudengoi]|nr:NAD(P)-binding protein [Mycena rebaudengoi]
MTPANVYAFLRQSYFCGKPTWSEHGIPDLSGQVIIVTGGNSGLGKETVRALLKHNARVHLASRSRKKAEVAISDIFKSTGKTAIFLELDLADLSSVKAAAEEFLSKEKELHVLYNNAGVMLPPLELTTRDGYDLTFGTNVIGHFYLTKLLLPLLTATAATRATAARVVNLTSTIRYLAVPDYETLTDKPARLRANPIDLYSQSKWAIAVFSAELARRYGNEGIVSMSVNPGNIRTNLSQYSFGLAYLATILLMIWPVEWGVLGQLWAGTSAEGELLNGKYIGPWGRIANPKADVNDPQNGDLLWNWLERQVEVFES